MADPFAQFDQGDEDTYASPFGLKDTPRLQQEIAKADAAAGDPFASFDKDITPAPKSDQFAGFDAPKPESVAQKMAKAPPQPPSRDFSLFRSETASPQLPEGFGAPTLKEAARALKTPGYGGRAIGVGAERLMRGDSLGRAAERAAEATKPEYQAIPGERKGAMIGQASGDALLFTGLGAVAGPVAAAAVSPAARAAAPPVVSGAVGAAIGGLDGALSDMAAKGEIDTKSVGAAMTFGMLTGAGLHIGVDAAIAAASSRVSIAFLQRAANELRSLRRAYDKKMGIPSRLTPEEAAALQKGPVIEGSVVPPDIQEAVRSGKVTPDEGAQQATERFSQEMQIRATESLRDPAAAAQAMAPAVENLVRSGIPRSMAESQVAQALSRAAVQAEQPPQPEMTDPVPAGAQLPPAEEVLQPQPAEAAQVESPGALTSATEPPLAPKAPADLPAAGASDLPENVQRVMAETGIEDTDQAWSLAMPPEPQSLPGDLPGVAVPRAVPEGAVQAKADQVQPEDVLEGFRPDQQGDLLAARPEQASLPETPQGEQTAPPATDLEAENAGTQLSDEALKSRVAGVSSQVNTFESAVELLSREAGLRGMDAAAPELVEAIINDGREKMSGILEAMADKAVNQEDLDTLRDVFGRALLHENLLRGHIGASEKVPKELFDEYDRIKNAADWAEYNRALAAREEAKAMGSRKPLLNAIKRLGGLHRPSWEKTGHVSGMHVDARMWSKKGGLRPSEVPGLMARFGKPDGDELEFLEMLDAELRLKLDKLPDLPPKPPVLPPAPPPPPAPPAPGSPGQPPEPRKSGGDLRRRIAKATGLERAVPKDPKTAAVAKVRAEERGKAAMEIAELKRVAAIEEAKARSEERNKAEATISDMERAAAAQEGKLKERIETLKAKSLKESRELYGRLKEQRKKASGEKAAAEKQLRHEIKRAIIEQKWDQATRMKLVEYIGKYLPPEARGKYLGRVAKTNKPTDLASVFFEVQRDAWAIANKKLAEDIRVLADRLLSSKSFPVAVKVKIRELLDGIRLENWNSRTIDNINAQQALIDAARASGDDVSIPQALHDQIKKLAMQPLSELPPEQLGDIMIKLRYLLEEGRDLKQAIADMAEIERLESLVELSRGVNRLDYSSTRFGKKRRFMDPLMSWADSTKNELLRIVDFFQEANIYRSPIEIIAEQESPAAGDLLWRPQEEGYIQVAAYEAEAEDVVADIVKQLGRGYTDLEMDRITTAFMREQEGGREKLQQLGVTDAEIDAVVLTPKEKLAYKLRDFLNAKKTVDGLARVHAELNNGEFKHVVNRWPMKTDYEAPVEGGASVEDVLKRSLETKRKNVEQGILKERKEGAKQQIRRDIFGVFMDDVRETAMLLFMAKPIRKAHAIVSDPAYAEIAGDLRQDFWKNYLDVLARDGQLPRAKGEWVLNLLRRNLGTAALTFKPAVVAIQPASLGNAATIVGGDNLRDAFSAGPEWDEFVEKNMPLIMRRAGGDPSVREALDRRSIFSGAARVGFKPMVAVDLWTAKKVGLAAYFQYLKQHGLPRDPSNPVPQALFHAQSTPGRVMATPNFTEMPLALSRGGPIVKTALQFQSEVLAKFAILTHQVFGKGTKTKAEAVEDFMWLASALLYETGVRRAWKYLAMGTLLATGAITQKQYDDATKSGFGTDMLLNAVSSVPFVGKVADVIRFNSTGLPVADVTKDALQGGANIASGFYDDKPLKSQRGIIQALTAIAMLGGVPGSGIAGWFAKQTLRGLRDPQKRGARRRSGSRRRTR